MDSLIQTDLTLLQSIVAQCPIEGGNAVYQARALLALENIKLTYDDDLLCAGSQSFQIPSSETESIILSDELKVFPNPAKNSLTIQWKRIDFDRGNLVFYDVFGKQVLIQTLEVGINTKTINLEPLQGGLYFIQLTLDDEPLSVQKVIVNK